MKYLSMTLTKLISKLNKLFKKNTVVTNTSDYKTDNHDWDQHNDNVSF